MVPLDTYAATTAIVSPKPAVTWKERLLVVSLPLLSGLAVGSLLWTQSARLQRRTGKAL